MMILDHDSIQPSVIHTDPQCTDFLRIKLRVPVGLCDGRINPFDDAESESRYLESKFSLGEVIPIPVVPLTRAISSPSVAW